jgi:flagellar hook-associated protein 1 FlgK
MSLTSGLDVARSSLAVSAEQTALVSRNVARAGDAGASRKIANIVTAPDGGVRLASITRVTDSALFNNMLAATSDASGQQVIVAALDRFDETIGDPEQDTSPAALIGKLNDALQTYATMPQDAVRAQQVVSTAGQLATALNDATTLVQQVRSEADADIADGVDRLNTLLSRFETVNNAIIKGTMSGADVTDDLDLRDQILASISEQIGIRTVSRTNNDMAIYTDSGVTLFETRPRTVTFSPTLSYSANTTGNAVYADGVPITGNGGMAASTGRLVSLTTVRDSLAVTYQSQLDEIARGLIEAFAESDQSSSSLPDVPGLFTYPGAPAMPASGTVLTGLAGSIKVNPTIDLRQGGDPARLRDGGAGDPGNPAYVYNSTGAAGFTQRLQELLSGLSAQRAFDPAAQASPSASLVGFAASSASWLEETRKTASNEADYQTALLQRTSSALSKATGVNLDEEMTILLDLERSYQASTKLISTIDEMFGALLAAVG